LTPRHDIERQKLYYLRYDFRSPAAYINSHLKKNDQVITSTRVVDYYLDRTDYVYIPKEQSGGIVACDGKCYIWNGARLISDTNTINTLITSANDNLWIIAHSQRYVYRSNLDKYLDKNFKKNIVFENIDKSIYVYKF